MKKSALRFVALLCLLPLFMSCNLYQPLGVISGDETLHQAAQVCLHKGDYSCAIEYLNKMSDSPEKQQDLCTVTLAQAGMTLVTMVNVVAKGTTGSKLLSHLAQALVPWSSDKETYAANAKARCIALPAASTPEGNNLNTLLQALSYMTDCATRMAKTDQYVANVGGGACDQPGNGDGIITASDIATNALGTLGAGDKGMCDADAALCKADMDALGGMSAALRSAGLGDIAGNVDSLPPSGATDDLTRVALKQTF